MHGTLKLILVCVEGASMRIFNEEELRSEMEDAFLNFLLEWSLFLLGGGFGNVGHFRLSYFWV